MARDSYEQLKSGFEAGRINAVLLLSDRRNEDPRNDDLDGVLRVLRAGSEGLSSTPVRLFTIAYGRDARTPPQLLDGILVKGPKKRTRYETKTSV